jgi:hypothetical protein
VKDAFAGGFPDPRQPRPRLSWTRRLAPRPREVTAHSLYVLATGSLRSDRNISDLALQTLGGLIGAKPQKPLLVDLAHLAAYAACAAAGGNCPFYRLRNTGSLQ